MRKKALGGISSVINWGKEWIWRPLLMTDQHSIDPWDWAQPRDLQSQVNTNANSVMLNVLIYKLSASFQNFMLTYKMLKLNKSFVFCVMSLSSPLLLFRELPHNTFFLFGKGHTVHLPRRMIVELLHYQLN